MGVENKKLPKKEGTGKENADLSLYSPLGNKSFKLWKKN